MALGAQIVNKILSDEPAKANAKHVKGVYTGHRNYKIMCRLYYHFHIRGIRYERAVAVLHTEFDLSETRLEQLILQDREILDQLKTEKADSRMLQKRFPYFNWYM